MRVATREVIAVERNGQPSSETIETNHDATPSAVASFGNAADLTATARSRIAAQPACADTPHFCALKLTMSDRDRIRGQDLRTYNFENGVSRAIPIRSGHRAVKVRYADLSPADDPSGVAQDIYGNDAPTSHFATAKNLTTYGRDLLPVAAFVSAGDQSTTNLVFEWPLSDEDFPSSSELLSAFSITAGGSPATDLSVTRDSNADNRLIFEHHALTPGDIVTISYAKPTSGNILKGTRGIEVASFTGYPVGNPPLPLALKSAVILSGGYTMDLRFTRDLDPTAVPPTDSFRALSGGITHTVDRIEFDPDDPRVVRLFASLTPFSLAGTPKTIQYTRPANGGLRSAGGVEVADFFANAVSSTDPLLTVDDVTVTEGEDATADFTVRLTPAATATVTVDYATEDASAMAPGDYTATSGTLTFDAGETEKTVSVPIVDDSVEDDGETFNLRLSNPSGGDAVLAPRTFGIARIGNDESGTPAVTPLTAELSGAPDAHGGEAFTVELAFSEELPLSYRTLQGGDGQAGAIAVTGGAVTRAARVAAGENRRWTVTVEPDGTDDVTLTLPATTDCEAADAICTEDDRPLAAAVTATVPNAAPVVDTPFTVRLAGAPAEHDGSNAVSFEVHFSEEPHQYSFRTLRDETLDIRQGGTRLAPYVKRKNKPSNRAWTVTVEPASKADLTVAIAAVADCAAPGAVCNGDGEPLSNAVSATVLGPPGLSVADARVEEAAGAVMDFAVTMSRASASTVTVDYATSDGTATAGADYTASSGTLSFAPGETSKTVSVPVLDDAHDDGGETFALTLSNVSGGNAWLEDASATGTIENADAMPRAWIARFGRTVADQVIEAVQSRMRAPRTPGAEVSLGGRRIGLGPLFGAEGGAEGGAGERGGDAAARKAGESEGEAEAAREARGLAEWLRGGGDAERRAGGGSIAMTERELLLGSSFSLTAAAGAGPGGTVSLWGRGAVSRFDGREGRMTLDGEVASGMLGADWSQGRTAAGLIVGHSRGEGGYRAGSGGSGSGSGTGGTVSSTLTGLYPWGRYALTDRIEVWGVAGYGEGTLTLTPDDGPAIRTDLDLAMGAVGLRGVVVEAPETGGPELAVKTDAMGVRTSTAKVRGLSAAEAEVTRLRLGLEGSWPVRFEGGGVLTPSLEVGVRHDGGDAETGFGADIGGGIAWSDPQRGLSAEFRGRGLLSHEASGFRERGLSGSLSFDPRPDTGRGLALTLSQTMGAQASGGMDALLGRGTMTGLAANDPGSGSGAGGGGGDDLANRRFEMRLGYGFSALGDRFTSTPEVGVGFSNGSRDYSLGWKLVREARAGDPGALELALEATRRENDNAAPDAGRAEHAVGVRLTARW